MKTIYNQKQAQLEWAIIKTPNGDAEHFDRAQLAVFLIGGGTIHALTVSSVTGGVLVCPIPTMLPSGVYDVKAIWVKNEVGRRNYGGSMQAQVGSSVYCGCGHQGQQKVNWELDGRCLMSAYSDCLFCITDNAGEDTFPGNYSPVIKAKSVVASYGYDGLSAYEASVLRGYFIGTEEEYLKKIMRLENFIAEQDSFNEEMEAFKEDYYTDDPDEVITNSDIAGILEAVGYTSEEIAAIDIE